MTDRPLGDEMLIRQAARHTAVRVAALVATAMLLLVALVSAVVVRGQGAAADKLLRTTVQSADDVGDPPPGSWLVLDREGQVQRSPGLPVDTLPYLARLRAAAGPGVTLTGVRTADHHEFRVATQRRSGAVVQAVLDLEAEHQQRARLLSAATLAAVVALLMSAGLGLLLGRRTVRPLADALALQRAFVADASHELRTPLTLLSTRAQLLDAQVRAGVADEQLRRDAAAVVDDVHRLGEVLEDLLIAADPATQEPVDDVDVGALAVQAADSARPHAERSGVVVEVDTTGLPQELVVLGSAPALRRAVLSLVDNAIEHTPTGGRVTVAVRRENRHVVVEVADTGPGIDPAAARDVLRRFHSGGQRAGRRHYGLGLALTNDVANRHGGSLQLLEPRPGTGAIFALRLPAR